MITIKKEKKKRNRIKNNEIKNKIISFIISNKADEIIESGVEEESPAQKDFYFGYLKTKINNKSITNFCFLTKNKRSIIKGFGLKRGTFKDLVYKKLLPGVKKISW